MLQTTLWASIMKVTRLICLCCIFTTMFHFHYWNLYLLFHSQRYIRNMLLDLVISSFEFLCSQSCFKKILWQQTMVLWDRCRNFVKLLGQPFIEVNLWAEFAWWGTSNLTKLLQEGSCAQKSLQEATMWALSKCVTVKSQFVFVSVSQ
jgi:hypothetical protein